MIRACSQQFSESWDFAEKSFEHSISLHTLFIIGLIWFRLLLSNFQKTEILLRRVLNTRFHCRHFKLLVCYDSGLFSAIFRKLRRVLNTYFFIPSNFNYWSILILGLSQQFSASWDFAETTFKIVFFNPSNFCYWYVVILGLSQQFSANWDFAEMTI